MIEMWKAYIHTRITKRRKREQERERERTLLHAHTRARTHTHTQTHPPTHTHPERERERSAVRPYQFLDVKILNILCKGYTERYGKSCLVLDILYREKKTTTENSLHRCSVAYEPT